MTNGYCKIVIDGKDVGIKFAVPAVRWYQEAAAKVGDVYLLPEDYGGVSGFSSEGLAKLIQCGYRNNCLIKEIEPEYNYETFFDYVNKQKETEEGRKSLVDLLQVYTDSTEINDLMEKHQKKIQSQNPEQPSV